MSDIERLLEVMRRLRDPEHGCPWDRQQTFATIVPYTIEESYEVADAIERNDMAELRDELGDLLFQVVFYAQLATEAGAFDFRDVTEAIVEKLLRRHPHVFGGAKAQSPEAVREEWETHKARERAAKAQHSALDGVSRALPALTRALKLQKRAARAGLDGPDVASLLETLTQKIDGLGAEIHGEVGAEPLRNEIGELLFRCVSLARHAGFDPEGALRAANNEFERRFRAVEASLAVQGKTLDSATQEEIEALWRRTGAGG